VAIVGKSVTVVGQSSFAHPDILSLELEGDFLGRENSKMTFLGIEGGPTGVATTLTRGIGGRQRPTGDITLLLNSQHVDHILLDGLKVD